MSKDNEEKRDLFGENHIATSFDTPLRADAFERSDDEKMELISEKFKDIMEIMGLDLGDDSIQGTPKRVAKMFVKEVFSGLNPANKPDVTLFDNIYGYDKMLVEKNISFYSFCEHHFLPIIGTAHIAYIPKDKVVGLSKINRLVKYYAKRPQVQERLTRQILESFKEELHSEDVAIVIEAKHLCVCARGVEDVTSTTVTSFFSGKLEEQEYKKEFLTYVKSDFIKD